MFVSRLRGFLAASLIVVAAAACAGDADTDDDGAAGTGENTIMPAGDQTGGAGEHEHNEFFHACLLSRRNRRLLTTLPV